MTPSDTDGLVSRLPPHVEWLACHATGMTLMKWNEISNDFLQSAHTIEAQAARIAELKGALEAIAEYTHERRTKVTARQALGPRE